MALPINIEDLLRKQKIEGSRIEFKGGWNPDSIYHSICAFANDFDNIGGGYILVGVEEENGIAKRPVKGLPVNEIKSKLKSKHKDELKGELKTLRIILDLMIENPEITTMALVERSGKSRSTVQKSIRILKNEHCIDRGGGKKYGRWIVLM